MELNRSFAEGTADGYARVPEVGSLVGVGIARVMNVEWDAGFGSQFPVVVIATLPDKVK